jgi:two-component system LytT family response regulator
MKTLKVILIDDEPNALKTLTTILQEFCEQIEIVGTANSALEGIKITQKLQPDLVFLDVDMPSGTGFDFLEAFPKRTFKVIFTTASSEHAIKAIKAQAEDYLMKPVDLDELQTSLDNLRQVMEMRKSYDFNKIPIPTASGAIYARQDEIIHLNNAGNYCTFFLKNKPSLLTSKNIGFFADLLNGKPFFRCHQSHIININEVQELNRTDGVYVLMSNGNRIDVSRSKKDELLQLLG